MRIRIAAIRILLVLSATLTAAMQSGNDLYQQGLARETAGDIKGAFQIFERIVRDFSSNRTLTAKALLQLGRWSELLGQDQATKYYDRLRETSGESQSDLIAKWSPDGRWTVLGRATSRWDTFVIENPMASALRATTTLADGRNLSKFLNKELPPPLQLAFLFAVECLP